MTILSILNSNKNILELYDILIKDHMTNMKVAYRQTSAARTIFLIMTSK